MNFLRSQPIYTFLLAAFFCLHGSLENFGFISFIEAIEVFFYVLLGIAVVFLIFYLCTRSILYSGFVTFLIGALYLFFEPIKDVVFGSGILKSYTLFLPLILFFFIVTIIAVKRNNWYTKTTFYLNILLILYCLLDFSMVINRLVNKKDISNTGDAVFNKKIVKAKPNIYLLLFDEYAGLESLKDSFNYDNSDMYKQLKNDSFQILTTFSNYNVTAFSMSSLFQMNYLTNLENTSTVGWKQIQQCMLEIKNAPVFNHFKSMGYDVKTFSLFEVFNNKSVGANQFLLGHKRVLTHKMFHNIILKDIGFNFTSGKLESPFLQKLILGDSPDYNAKVEGDLLKVIDDKVPPQFVYAHFLMPHYPFLFDSTGKKNSLHHIFKVRAWLDKVDYVSYLKYCTKKMIEMEKNIISKDSNAIVVLMSDHGFRTGSAKPSASVFNNFCAVRNLTKNELTVSDTISNVNLFRYIFNTSYNQSFPYIKNRTVFLVEK